MLGTSPEPARLHGRIPLPSRISLVATIEARLEHRILTQESRAILAKRHQPLSQAGYLRLYASRGDLRPAPGSGSNRENSLDLSAEQSDELAMSARRRRRRA